MPKKPLTSEESRHVMLRTTADVVSHAIKQIECCAGLWPEYQADAKEWRAVSERLVAHAREYGYIGGDN